MINLGSTIYEPTTPIHYVKRSLNPGVGILDFSDDNQYPSDAKEAKRAILVVERRDNTTDKIIARFIETGEDPDDDSHGVPLTDLSVYEIRANALRKLKIIAANGVSSNLHIHFYI